MKLDLLGVSMVSRSRSPFRMPIGERVFRFAWLGRFGREFLRRPSLADLEQRVRALDQRRRTHSGSA